MALEQFNGPVILEIPSDPASLFIVRALVSKLAERIGFVREQSDRLVLATDEACTNVIRHAYGGGQHERIILTFFVNLDYFEIDIRDFGPGADPASFQSRALEQIRPGGLGMHFIKAAFDKIDYDAPPDGGMLLKLIKFRPKQETGKSENPR